MCQTALISQNIVRLGTRTFRHRLKAISGRDYNVVQLKRLNRDLATFYKLLYGQINSVTADDYHIFGPQLQLMLSNIHELYNVCEQFPENYGMKKEIRKLGMNYSAISEINYDIVNFRLETAQRPRLKSLLASASKALSSIGV